MLTPTQKQTAQSIVNLFETGAVLGEYGSVTVIPGDTGHLTFGRSQTTLGSGNLHDLLQRYCRNDGARFGHRLAPWLPRFAAVDLGLDNEPRLHNLLRATADDPVMRETQDQFFDEVYWQTAARIAANLGVTSALGTAVVYDSTVHGSWKAMRDRTIAQSGSIATLGEKKWIAAYVATRRTWLTKHPRSDLRKTAYRMDAFQRLIEQGYWGLELPLVVRGAEISSTTLNPHDCAAKPIGPRARRSTVTTGAFRTGRPDQGRRYFWPDQRHSAQAVSGQKRTSAHRRSGCDPDWSPGRLIVKPTRVRLRTLGRQRWLRSARHVEHGSTGAKEGSERRFRAALLSTDGARFPARASTCSTPAGPAEHKILR